MRREDGSILEANSAAERAYGYSRDEMLKLVIKDLRAAGTLGLTDSQMAQTDAGGILFETIHRRKDGSTFPVEVSSQGATIDGTRTLISVIRDITKRKRAEEALKKKTSFLEALVYSSHDGILVVSDGKKILQNQRTSDLWKIPKDIAEQDDIEKQVTSIINMVKKPQDFREKALFDSQPKASWHGEVELIDGTVLDRDSYPVEGADGEYYGRLWTFRDITERKKAEEDLRTSRLQLAEAAGMARIAYWEHDEATGEFIFNDAFYELYGTTAEQEGGYRMPREEYVRRFIHPDDREELRRQVDENRAHPRAGDLEQYEHRAVRRDGEVIHILTRNRVVMDSEGRVLKAAGVNQDITARKKMDEALRESEARYRSLFESSLDGIMLTQPDGTVLAVNRRACEMLRMTEEEIVRAGRAGIVVDDERLQAALAERAKTGKWQGELTHRRSDGSTFPAEISSNVFAGADGKEMAAMVLRDITERKLAEQALKESKARLDLALQSASMGVWYWDLVEDRRSFDDQVCHLLGIEPAAFTGTADEFFDAVHPDDREMLKAALTRTIEHDVPYEPEYRAVWPDGSIHYIAARGRLVRHDASNRPERINGIIWDITERKQAEAYREAGREILQILNEAGDLQDTIQRVLTVLKTRIGFDAVGIRLQDGDDFPYIAQEGFSQDFLLAENALIERAADGGVCRDRDGKARLEGTCGMVISGKTDPANPLFTPRGSWWTNDSLALLDILPGEDPRFHPRNRCVHLGYASVALVPIRTRDSIVGLVHLNDRRKGRFTVDTVEFLEGIASHIGQALMRKRAEDALRESETKLRAIFDGSRDAIGVSKDGIHFFANPAYVSLFGYENADELIGKPTTEFVAPESRGLVNERVEKRAKGEAVPPSYEATGLRKDGTTFLLEATISLYALKGEQFTLAVLRDITERKRAEEEVKLFKHSVDVHYDGAYWINADNEFIYVNGAACKILGYERDELIGKPISLVSSRVTDEAMKGIWERLRKRGSFLGEGVHRRRDGSEFPADIVATYVQFGGKEYACGFARDITDKKRLEDQLRQAQKMEAVGTLAGGVAHDFNNILTVIMGLGNLMQMEIDEDDIHRAYIDQIVASSERAADLTQSLLAFSRKQRITLEPHKVNGVVTSTAKLLTRLLPEDIRLSMNLTDKDTSSLLDVTQIGQVLMNLATNARDAMPHGGSLTIATERAKIDKTFTKTHGFGRTGDYVKLSVSDTGIGIDESTTKRIFEPFFTTKEVGKGTGLGLASVYGIVKQHNGYVTVSSVPFTGTTFDIYLPLIKAPSRQKARAKGEIKGGTETILIVEDDRDVRHVLTSILEGQGYTTIEAVDGDDAIKTHCEHKEDIELIILDVVMPLRNGKEILDEITRVDPLAKAIFISGYTGDVAIDKGIHSDSVDFLQKPLSIPALLAKVREVLDR